MINLAGEQNADKHILEELYLAGIEPVKTDQSKGEVPYTYIGRIGKWKLKRLWYYWSASVGEKETGLSLNDAMKLHNMKHPTDNTVIIGDTVRAGGHAGGISPDDYVSQPVRSELVAELKELGLPIATMKSKGFGDDDEKEYPDMNYGEIAKLSNEGKLKSKRYVDCYHIDDQIGLKEFASFIKSLK